MGILVRPWIVSPTVPTVCNVMHTVSVSASIHASTLSGDSATGVKVEVSESAGGRGCAAATGVAKEAAIAAPKARV